MAHCMYMQVKKICIFTHKKKQCILVYLIIKSDYLYAMWSMQRILWRTIFRIHMYILHIYSLARYRFMLFQFVSFSFYARNGFNNNDLMSDIYLLCCSFFVFCALYCCRLQSALCTVKNFINISTILSKVDSIIGKTNLRKKIQVNIKSVTSAKYRPSQWFLYYSIFDWILDH